MKVHSSFALRPFVDLPYGALFSLPGYFPPIGLKTPRGVVNPEDGTLHDAPQNHTLVVQVEGELYTGDDLQRVKRLEEELAMVKSKLAWLQNVGGE
jgi:hypothetical protein